MPSWIMRLRRVLALPPEAKAERRWADRYFWQGRQWREPDYTALWPNTFTANDPAPCGTGSLCFNHD